MAPINPSAQTLLNQLPCGYLQISGTGIGTIEVANQTLAQWVNRPVESLAGQPITLLLPKASSLFFHSQVLPQTKLGGQLEECYLKLVNRDGARFSILANLSYRYSEGRDIYDVTLTRMEKRHRLEEAYVQAKQKADDAMADLQHSNEILSRFAGMVAHDLKSPIRHMGTLSQFIAEDYGDVIDESGQDLLTKLVNAAVRSSYFIDKLLEYGSLSLGERERSPVDLNQTLTAVRDNLLGPIEETQAEIDIQELPTVLGFEVQLEQLFQNLLGNAIKYCHPQRKPTIKVYAEKESQEQWKIWVEDNGIGIATQDHRKVFDILHRLHGKNIEGSGIGLATCKWVVQNHGGDIGVESGLEQGSRFYVTLPITAK